MSIVNTNAVAKVAAVVAGLGLVFASFAPVTRAADSAADLQAQIASLLAQISSLQSQLGTSGSTSAAVMFNADLTLGSSGADVTALQNWLISKGYSIPAGATGYFGAQTQSALAAYQAANAISPAAGYFGPVTRAKVNASAGTSTGTGSTGTGSTGTSTTLKGGAGDLSVKGITAGTETTVGEGKEEKVLGFEGEADVNSDIEVTSVRVSADLSNMGSTRLNRYVDEVVVYLGDKEVGSMDASDFSRSGSVSTGTITLKNAIVRADTKERFYVAFVANDVIDSDDFGDTINVSADRIRYADATGVILTENPDDVEADVSFEDGATDDGAKVQSSSNNPDASVLKVKENSTSDEYQVFTFRLRGDSDTSDISITSLPIKLTITNPDGDDANTDDIISDIYVKVDGQKYDDYDRDEDSDVVEAEDSVDAVYTFDIDEDDLVIGADDTQDVQVFVKFGKQSGKYAAGTTVKAAVVGTQILAENEDGDDVEITGTVTGKEHTLSLSSATVDGFTWNVDSSGSLIDFLFTVEADDEDYEVLASSIASSTTGTATASAGTLTLVTGDAEQDGSDYTVNSGDTATFMVRYAITGANGTFKNVKMTSVAGQAVPNAKQLSPTAVRNVQASS